MNADRLISDLTRALDIVSTVATQPGYVTHEQRVQTHARLRNQRHPDSADTDARAVHCARAYVEAMLGDYAVVTGAGSPEYDAREECWRVTCVVEVCVPVAGDGR